MTIVKTVLSTALVGVLVSGMAGAESKNDQPDAHLASEIREHLSQNPSLHGIASRVQVIDGVTYLYGRVDTPREVYEVESIVAALPGVTKVVNSLEPEPN